MVRNTLILTLLSVAVSAYGQQSGKSQAHEYIQTIVVHDSTGSVSDISRISQFIDWERNHFPPNTGSCEAEMKKIDSGAMRKHLQAFNLAAAKKDFRHQPGIAIAIQCIAITDADPNCLRKVKMEADAKSSPTQGAAHLAVHLPNCLGRKPLGTPVVHIL